MTQWWYGHNAVAFFLTAGFLGMMYYYLPKRAGRPIYSYRMSIVGFWGITFFYMWAGSHHLHYTALPLHGYGGCVLWPFDIRGIVHGDPAR